MTYEQTINSLERCSSWSVVKIERFVRPKKLARKKQMIEMRKRGETYAQIGRAFGITRQRVFQILKGCEL